jgi:hypothetical protein
MSVFKNFLFIGFFQINSHVTMIYYEFNIQKKIYFQHQIKLSILNMEYIMNFTVYKKL